MAFLRYLDVMIGYALGMAMLSTLIGGAAGVWLGVIRSRTRHMQGGLASLIQSLGAITEAESRELAGAILMDDTVKVRNLSDWFADPTDGKTKLGAVTRFIRSYSTETIQREELVMILLRKASEGNWIALKAMGLYPELALQREAGAQSLLAQKEEGIAASGAAIDGLKQVAATKLLEVEEKTLQLEFATPDLPAQVWRTKALAEVVPTMTSKLFSRFDNMMDRLEDNVADSGKVASVVFAAIFLSWYPVDSIAMLTRLSTSDALRAKAVAAAEKQNVPLEERQDIQDGLFGNVFLEKKDFQWGVHLFGSPGVLVTWVMVSMGGPFWLNQLSRLLGLRSEMARKLTEQRNLRDKDLRPGAPVQPGG